MLPCLLFSVLKVLQKSPFDAGSRRTKFQASKTQEQGHSLMSLCATAKLSFNGVCVPTLAFSTLTYYYFPSLHFTLINILQQTFPTRFIPSAVHLSLTPNIARSDLPTHLHTQSSSSRTPPGLLSKMASLRRTRTMPTDGAISKFLYVIMKQLDLKSVSCAPSKTMNCILTHVLRSTGSRSPTS